MVSMLTSSAVQSSGPIKIDICCFSAKHTGLRSKSKDMLAWNQDYMSEWSDVSSCGLLSQLASTIKIQLDMLFWSTRHVVLVNQACCFGQLDMLFWSTRHVVLVNQACCFGQLDMLFWSTRHVVLVN